MDDSAMNGPSVAGEAANVAEADVNVQGGTGGGETTKNSTSAATGGKTSAARSGTKTGASRDRAENLRPFDQLPPEEARRIQIAGGKARGAQRSYAAKMRATWQAILSMPYQAGKKERPKDLASAMGANTTVGEKILIRTVAEYMKTGNPRLLELMMRYAGAEETIAEQAQAVAQAQVQAQQQMADGGLVMALLATGADVFEGDVPETPPTAEGGTDAE